MKGMPLRRQLNPIARAGLLVAVAAVGVTGCSGDDTRVVARTTEAVAPTPPAAGSSPSVDVPSTTDVTPTDVAPTDVAPTDVAPTDATPTDATPTDATPTDATPTDATPTDATETPTPAPVPDGWAEVTAADDTFVAAVPARYVDARQLLEADDLSATLDELGVELDAGEATEMLGEMSMEQVPWFVFDRQTLSSGFSDNINILPAGPTNGVTAEQVRDQLDAAGATFGETPLGPREVVTVGSFEAVQYDYELPVDAATVRGRQLFVLADQLYVASQTSTDDRFEDRLLGRVASTIRPS